jgi:hypothetical protein
MVAPPTKTLSLVTPGAPFQSVTLPARRGRGPKSPLASPSNPRASGLLSSVLTVVNQIIEDMFGQPVGIMLASLGKGNDLFDDHLRHRVIAVAFEQERIADLPKDSAHGLDMRRVYVVL